MVPYLRVVVILSLNNTAISINNSNQTNYSHTVHTPNGSYYVPITLEMKYHSVGSRQHYVFTSFNFTRRNAKVRKCV